MSQYASKAKAVSLDAIENWKPSVQDVRDACLEGRIVALNVPSVSPEFWVRDFEIESLVLKVIDAVRSGRMLDCGDLPNEVIKIGGKRGGMLYNAGLLAHPFTLPWVLYHRWDEGVAVYLIELRDGNPAGGETEIVELNPMLLSDAKVLCVGDRVVLEPASDGANERYQGTSRPSTWRLAFAARTGDQSPTMVAGAAMANCLDPFVTALLLLHTDGVPVIRIEPAEKLNKARRKAGKPPLPPRLRIDSAPYVTALLARQQRRQRQQHQQRTISKGSHASPVFHWRMGHWRYFQDGQQPSTAQRVQGTRGPWRIRVRDTVVNAKGETREAFMRSHYTLRSSSS